MGGCDSTYVSLCGAEDCSGIMLVVEDAGGEMFTRSECA